MKLRHDACLKTEFGFISKYISNYFSIKVLITKILFLHPKYFKAILLDHYFQKWYYIFKVMDILYRHKLFFIQNIKAFHKKIKCDIYEWPSVLCFYCHMTSKWLPAHWSHHINLVFFQMLHFERKQKWLISDNKILE